MARHSGDPDARETPQLRVDGAVDGLQRRRRDVLDIDVDGTPTGIYMEHFTTSSTFRNLHVGTASAVGVNAKWADPSGAASPRVSTT